MIANGVGRNCNIVQVEASNRWSLADKTRLRDGLTGRWSSRVGRLRTRASMGEEVDYKETKDRADKQCDIVCPP